MTKTLSSSLLITLAALAAAASARTQASGPNEAATARHYASLIAGAQPKTAELVLFFSQMPKGGDLNHHYSGAIYAETYVDWLDKQGYCVNKLTYKIETDKSTVEHERAWQPKDRTCLSSSDVYADDATWRELLQRWSSKDFNNHGAIQPPPVSWALFGERRMAATLFLWVSYFFTLIVLYFLLNWLPSLMAAQGLSRPQVGMAQILFNIGGGAGALGIGMLMDAARPRWVVSGMYVGIIAALSLLAAAGGMASMSAGAFMAGLFVIGAQSVLYALAAAYYPTVVRGTGVGAAVAVGRLGSIAGPLLAGQLLAMGQHATTIIGASIPVTIIAALAALLLLKRPRVQD